MADRSSASVFGQVFALLAKDPEKFKAVAHQIYALTKFYDFNDCQMECDEECIRLGIAVKGVSPEDPECGKITLWPDDPGYKEAMDADDTDNG